MVGLPVKFSVPAADAGSTVMPQTGSRAPGGVSSVFTLFHWKKRKLRLVRCPIWRIMSNSSREQ